MIKYLTEEFLKKIYFIFRLKKKTLFIRKTLKLEKYRIIMYHFRFSPATCLRRPKLRLLLLLSLPAPAPTQILRRSLKQPQAEQAAPPAAQFCFCLRDRLDKHHTNHLGQEAEVISNFKNHLYTALLFAKFSIKYFLYLKTRIC